MSRILQIIPADGRLAELRDEDGNTWYEPVVCFGLVEEENLYVEPFVYHAGYIAPASSAEYYYGICRGEHA